MRSFRPSTRKSSVCQAVLCMLGFRGAYSGNCGDCRDPAHASAGWFLRR